MKLFPFFKPTLIISWEQRDTLYRPLPSKQISWKHDMEKTRNTQRPEEKLKNWDFFYPKQRSEEVHEDSLPMERNNLYFMPMLDRN